MKSLPKIAFFIFVSLLITSSFLFVKVVQAKDPVPPYNPNKIPCDATQNPEFNSDRPYQASPCGDSVKATYCSNKLTFYEQVKGPPQVGDVDFVDVNIPMPQKTYVIDIKDAELPILGNTEQVKNSQSGTDTLDDAAKMNEYVSWYLNGVTNRAEYGESKLTNENIVNFSGPLNKLLPDAILNAQRIDSILNATTKTTFQDEDTDKPNTDMKNHDQVVVCYTREFGILGPVKARDCYDGGNSDAKSPTKLLSDWSGGLSNFNTFFNWLGTDIWNKKFPPLPWQFKSEILYTKAYNEWRGKTCTIVPGINKLVCIDNPLVSNEWADLFPYIPLANTTDKNAKQFVESTVVRGSGDTEITQPEKPTSAELEDPTLFRDPVFYFAHTLESVELVKALRGTYVPEDGTNSKPVTETTEPDNSKTDKCQVVNVRSNEGDNLFPDANPNSEIRVTVKPYTVTRIPCQYSDALSKQVGRPMSTCKGEVSIGLKTDSRTPYANEIYNTTTAGADSVFRKIFPKVEDGAPVSCVADSPGQAAIDYQSGQNVKDLKVTAPDGTNTTDNPQVYFAHLGSVYDYFLKGIQTALRPQGFGTQIESGALCGASACKGVTTTPDLPAASGSCKMGGTPFGIADNLKTAIEAAAQTYKVPPSLLVGVMYGEGAFNDATYSDKAFVEEQLKGCATLPKCNPNGSVINNIVPFFPTYWDGLKDAVKKIDPKRTPNACNLLDGIFALAKDLSQNQGKYSGFTGKSCFGVPLNSNGPSSGSCTWTDTQAVTAIKVWETGYDNTCYSGKGSCYGGLSVAPCTLNSTDPNCETKANHSSDNATASHVACIYDVWQGNK